MLVASNFSINFKQGIVLCMCLSGLVVYMIHSSNTSNKINKANSPKNNKLAIVDVDDSLEQTDTTLIEYVRKHVLEPPDQLPYSIKPTKRPSIIMTAFQTVFQNKRNGVFFEGGAYNGHVNSATLLLEQHFNWTGLLVEGNPSTLQQLRNTHRKAFIAPVYVSDTKFPRKVLVANNAYSTFAQPLGDVDRVYKCGERTHFQLRGDKLEEIQNRADCHPVKDKIVIQSIPLFTLLKAAGFTDIDFLSLDVEGLEENVLETLPFDQVNIKVAMVEKTYQIPPESSREKNITDIMVRKGYEPVETINGIDLKTYYERDLFFVKKGLLNDKFSYH